MGLTEGTLNRGVDDGAHDSIEYRVRPDLRQLRRDSAFADKGGGGAQGTTLRELRCCTQELTRP